MVESAVSLINALNSKIDLVLEEIIQTLSKSPKHFNKLHVRKLFCKAYQD